MAIGAILRRLGTDTHRAVAQIPAGILAHRIDRLFGLRVGGDPGSTELGRPHVHRLFAGDRDLLRV